MLVLSALAVTGCADNPKPAVTALRAPNPNGCYVMVYDQPEFRGAGDVFNGPARWASLEGLLQTNERNWRERIRSLRVGQTATLTVYAAPGFNGDSRQFPSGSEHPRLDPALSARIESLEFICSQR